MIDIQRAGPGQVDLTAPLFDAYRQFYQQPPDLPLARRFLTERLTRGDSILLLATERAGPAVTAAGFTQIYPSWSSIACHPAWILSDLFVADAFRRRGIARRLMEAAHHAARAAGAGKVELDTAHDNGAAQALYETLGYRRDMTFRHYTFTL